MNFYTDLFTPETWAAFIRHGSTVSGFRESQLSSAKRVEPGDILICYLVRLSRWCGLLRVTSPVYVDSVPIFENPDPFVVRFKVEPITILDIEHSIPIFDDEIWPKLSLTQDIEFRRSGWAQLANLRSSLRPLPDSDGQLLSSILRRQGGERRVMPLSEEDQRRLRLRTSVHTEDRSVVVEVPQDEAEDEDSAGEAPDSAPRDSHRVQALLAKIGAEMGFRIWIPRSDRQRISALVPSAAASTFLELLPLNYNDTTLKTVEQIDIIWLKNRSMVRAFEVEHTTAIYSGLLRMADLLALQPNMNIRLHIVAPSEKREKVLREIKRPVFSLLGQGPLYERCSYLPYEAVEEIAAMKYLPHMSDSIVEEYEEFSQDE